MWMSFLEVYYEREGFVSFRTENKLSLLVDFLEYLGSVLRHDHFE